MNLNRSKSTTLSEDGRAFLQHRVSRYGLVAGSIFGGFWLFRMIGLGINYKSAVEFGYGFGHPSLNYHLLAALFLLGVWLFTCRGEISPFWIRAVETVGIVGASGMIILMGLYVPLAGRPDDIVVMALGSALTIRAIFVPSSATRTFVIAVLIGAESLVGVYWMFKDIDLEAWSHVQANIVRLTQHEAALAMVGQSSAWWAITAITTTSASLVIYGLRKDASKAKKLGQYQLDDKLGEGGMGVVYRAHHALLRRPTAVKLLLPEKAGERSIERFEREVRLMAKLRHPNTITVFDYGRSPDGIFYYAMEYIDGATLSDVIGTTGPMEPARTLGVMSQAVSAMVEAHGVGLIHRDIKPANLMLFLPHRYGGIGETIKVLDFGLVKDVSAESSITQVGSITGTPHYMAPEAIRDPESVDARSDIYALGCLLFYLITGEHVFDGNTVIDVCAKHLKEAPSTMSERLGKPVDSRLEAIVSECLAKDRGDRPSSAIELETRLAEITDLGEFTAHDAAEWWDEYGSVLVHDTESADKVLTIDFSRARSILRE